MTSKRRMLESKVESKETEVPYCIPENPIDKAVAVLMNNRSVLSTGAVVFDPAILKLARGLFTSMKQYRFDLHRAGTLTSSGGSSLAISHGMELSLFGEGAALASLFDEVKLLSATWSLVGVPTSTPCPAFHVAFNPDTLASDTPTTTLLVARIPGSKIFTSHAAAGTSVLQSVSLTARPYSAVSDSAPATPVFAGCRGSFWLISDNALLASTVYYSYHTVARMVFRCRA